MSAFSGRFPYFVCRHKNEPLLLLGGELEMPNGWEPYGAVFSSDDLAERYIADRNSSDAVVSKIEGVSEWLELLRDMKSARYIHVVFDDNTKVSGAKSHFTIDEIIEQTAKKIYGS